MNDVLQQLIALSPGIVSGVRGNGLGMQAFLDAYQRTSAQLDQQARQQRIDQQAQQDHALALTDRQRAITRQQAADQRLQGDQQYQDYQRTLQAMDALQRLGLSAPDQAHGEQMVDAAYAAAPPSIQSSLAPARDTAIQNIAPAITARQKRQLGEWLEKWSKSEFAKQAEGHDPEVVNIPEHLQTIAGGPSAKLSTLMQISQMPVALPKKDASAEPSMQSKELLGPDGKPHVYNFNPKTGKYDEAQGVSPIPPREPKGDSGGLSPNQEALLTERLAKDWQSQNQSAKEINRQFGVMQTGLDRFRGGDKNGGSQAVLVTFQKILDPSSVVRESEYARSAAGISLLGRLQGYADRLKAGGAGVPEAELAQMVETAREIKNGMAAYSAQSKSRISAMAGKYKIAPELIFGMDDQSAAPNATTPKFQVGQKVRNKKTGELGEVTGVRPDGSPIITPVKQ